MIGFPSIFFFFFEISRAQGSTVWRIRKLCKLQWNFIVLLDQKKSGKSETEWALSQTLLPRDLRSDKGHQLNCVKRGRVFKRSSPRHNSTREELKLGVSFFFALFISYLLANTSTHNSFIIKLEIRRANDLSRSKQRSFYIDASPCRLLMDERFLKQCENVLIHSFSIFYIFYDESSKCWRTCCKFMGELLREVVIINIQRRAMTSSEALHKYFIREAAS